MHNASCKRMRVDEYLEYYNCLEVPSTIPDHRASINTYVTTALHTYMQRDTTINQGAKSFAYLYAAIKSEKYIVMKILNQYMQTNQNIFTNQVLNKLLDAAQSHRNQNLISAFYEFFEHDFANIQNKMQNEFARRLINNTSLSRVCNRLASF